MKKIMSLLLEASLFFMLIPSVVFAAANGGGSDGGGNSYKGKPIESYAQDPKTLPAYQSLILPLLADIQSKAASNNSMDVLAHLILSVFEQKTWYFVPGPLSQIPPELLNSAVPTDQAALQGFDRVWIDRDIWNKMAVEDQEKLILHETFMGFKILSFGSELRQCNAADGINSSYCDDQGSIDSGINLKAQDYADVQNMTIQVASQYPQMTADDWVNAINLRNFNFEWDWFRVSSQIKPEQLGEMLKRSAMTGYVPTHGYDLKLLSSEDHPPVTDVYNYFQNHKENCQFQATINGNELQISLSGKYNSVQFSIPVPAEFNSDFADTFHENRKLQRISVPGYESLPTPRPTGGYTTYNFFLGFDSFQLAEVYIQEMVCETKDCSDGHGSLAVKGGFNYICSDNPQMFKPN